MIQTGIQSLIAAGGINNASRNDVISETTVQEHAKEFESVFLSLLVKEMRKTVGEGGLLNSESTDSLGGLFDLYIGQSLAESEPLGIASIWMEQYRKNSPS